MSSEGGKVSGHSTSVLLREPDLEEIFSPKGIKATQEEKKDHNSLTKISPDEVLPQLSLIELNEHLPVFWNALLKGIQEEKDIQEGKNRPTVFISPLILTYSTSHREREFFCRGSLSYVNSSEKEIPLTCSDVLTLDPEEIKMGEGLQHTFAIEGRSFENAEQKTASHLVNLLFHKIPPAHRPALQAKLREHGIEQPGFIPRASHQNATLSRDFSFDYDELEKGRVEHDKLVQYLHSLKRLTLYCFPTLTPQGEGGKSITFQERWISYTSLQGSWKEKCAPQSVSMFQSLCKIANRSFPGPVALCEQQAIGNAAWTARRTIALYFRSHRLSFEELENYFGPGRSKIDFKKGQKKHSFDPNSLDRFLRQNFLCGEVSYDCTEISAFYPNVSFKPSSERSSLFLSCCHVFHRCFRGTVARSRKEAKINAALVAYTSLRDCPHFFSNLAPHKQLVHFLRTSCGIRGTTLNYQLLPTEMSSEKSLQRTPCVLKINEVPRYRVACGIASLTVYGTSEASFLQAVCSAAFTMLRRLKTKRINAFNLDLFKMKHSK